MALFPSDTSQSPWTNPDDGVIYDFIDGVWVPQTGGSGGGAFDDIYVNVAGDVMTGLLELSGDPDNAKEAATKQYVDGASSTINQNLITLEQEIEVISPSRERGVYVHTSSTTPSAGEFHVNSAQYSSVTEVRVSTTDSDGGNHTYATVKAGDQLEILDTTTSDGLIATVDSLPVVASSYATFTVTIQRSEGGPVDGQGALVKVFTIAESDLNISDLEDKFVRKDTVAGDTMIGPLVLPDDPSLPLQASTMRYTDTKMPLDISTLPAI